MFTFYEFFSGGGMARAGLGRNWHCLFANDFDAKKCSSYQRNWGGSALRHADVTTLGTRDLPEHPQLVWASFPCQDLSLAGGGAGLRGERSGTFWPFWSLMKGLVKENRPPAMIVLENVCGTLTSHRGRDFESICAAFKKQGYRFGAMIIDAVRFLPQSRPRLFILAVHDSYSVPDKVYESDPVDDWHTTALRNAFSRLPRTLKENWIWWNPKLLRSNKQSLASIIEEEPTSVPWYSPSETRHLLGMMSEQNLAKVSKAMNSGERVVGTVYKRTRRDKYGVRVQRAEVRFDGIAGCLRTPAGGSSRQIIIVVEKNKIRSRLMSSRETARLMGLPDSYELPSNYNEAYHLTGDGVAVPVVRFIARRLVKLVLQENIQSGRLAA